MGTAAVRIGFTVVLLVIRARGCLTLARRALFFDTITRNDADSAHSTGAAVEASTVNVALIFVELSIATVGIC
jgi:hypothetical protein